MRIRILFLTAAWLLVLTASAPAFGRIVYPDRPLNLRAARSARAGWVGSLYPGQQVRIGFERDGWVAVFEPGETRADERYAVGFSNAKYLLDRRTRHEPESWGTPVAVTRNLNLRDKSSVRGRKLGMLKAGQVVKIDFPDGDWTRVFSPDATIRSEMNSLGYASAKYFVPAAPPAPIAEPAPARISPVVEAGEGQGRVVAEAAPPLPTPTPVAESAPAPAVKSAPAPVVEPTLEARPASAPAAPAAPQPSVAPTRAPSPASVTPPAASAPTLGTGTVATSGGKGGRTTLIIDRSRFSGAKRADPVPDRTAHGYQYRLLEKSETREYGAAWVTLKIFLSTTVLPKEPALKDFAETMWKENRRAGKNLAVLIYLPGMDTDDLSYAVVRFDDTHLVEYWVRRTTLFGTKFM